MSVLEEETTEGKGEEVLSAAAGPESWNLPTGVVTRVSKGTKWVANCSGEKNTILSFLLKEESLSLFKQKYNMGR